MWLYVPYAYIIVSVSICICSFVLRLFYRTIDAMVFRTYTADDVTKKQFIKYKYKAQKYLNIETCYVYCLCRVGYRTYIQIFM